MLNKLIPINVEDEPATPLRNALLNTQLRADTELRTAEQQVAYFQRVATWCSANLAVITVPGAGMAQAGHTGGSGSGT